MRLNLVLTLSWALLAAATSIVFPAQAQISHSTWGHGAIRVGDSTTTCNASAEGAIRYNDTTNVHQFCNGAAWANIAAVTCADTTPDAFSFTDQANVALSTLTTSNIVPVNGLGCVVNTAISGGGSPEYRICSDSGCSTVVQDWTTGTSALTSGQYLQLRLTSSASGGATLSTTVIAGNGASVWNVSTAGSCASSPPIGTVCADGTVYAGLSPDGSLPMYVTRCDAGMTWNGAACTGSRWTLTWNNGTTSWVSKGLTSTVTGEANTNTLAAASDAGADYAAAEHCFGYDDGNGNTDWYLPAQQELNIIENEKSAIGGFTLGGTSYWSATEISNSDARSQDFSAGSTTSDDKDEFHAVRCARR